MLVAYKTDWLTYQIAKRMVKVKYISLPNLLADIELVHEYIQKDANPEALAKGLLELIENAELQNKQTRRFTDLHKILQQGASASAAKAVDDMLYIKG